jgi:hypothetical protein
MIRQYKHIHQTVRSLPLVLVLAVGVLLASAPASAMEGGVSHYNQGTYGDFLMGYVPESGLYVRNDSMFQSTRLSGTVMGGRAYGRLDSQLVINLTKITGMIDLPAIGGFLGAGIGVPVIINNHITGSLAGNSLSRSSTSNQLQESHFQQSGGGNRGGISDIFLMPLIFAWNFGECHLVVSPVLFLPTGYYNANTLTNLGMNYLTFDGNVAFTWLNQQGYEVSFNAGYAVNGENRATNYQSGNEFHFDWTAAYHANERLALGAVGYLYAQTTPDTGSGATFGAYMSSAAGIGPAVSYTAPVAGKDVTLTVKWLHDVSAVNRLQGDVVYCSFAFQF